MIANRNTYQNASLCELPDNNAVVGLKQESEYWKNLGV